MTFQLPGRHPSIALRAGVAGTLGAIAIILIFIVMTAIGIFNTCTSEPRGTRSPTSMLRVGGSSESGLRAAAMPFKQHPPEVKP